MSCCKPYNEKTAMMVKASVEMLPCSKKRQPLAIMEKSHRVSLAKVDVEITTNSAYDEDVATEALNPCAQSYPH